MRDAVAAVNGEIAALLRGRDAADQAVIDAALRDLDGTPALARLGANAVLAASVACALAAAEAARSTALAAARARLGRRCFRCRWSTCSPAARTPGGQWTCRTCS